MENEDVPKRLKSNDIEIEESDIEHKKTYTDLNASNFDEKLDIEESKTLDFNVILVGDSNVGKTSILKKFVDGTFVNKLACTISV